MNLLRALFPSWRLFEDIGFVPRLFYRTDANPTWRIALTTPKRAWWSIIVNPEGNNALALHALLDRLVEEVNETPESRASVLRESVTYRLIERYVRLRLESRELAQRFQFKVVMQSTAQELDAPELLVSEEHHV